MWTDWMQLQNHVQLLAVLCAPILVAMLWIETVAKVRETQCRNSLHLRILRRRVAGISEQFDAVQQARKRLELKQDAPLVRPTWARKTWGSAA